MITKRNGNGQTECVRCKEKGKFALNWDSFLYTFNDKPYCFDCLMEMLEEKDNIINKAIEYIKELCMFINKDGKECYLHYGDDLSPNTLINILKGEDNE